MSIVRIAVRIAAIEAIRGRTLFGDNVLDSEIGTLQVDADGNLRTDEDAPFISVYTDAATTRDMDISLRGFAVNGATEILFEAGVTAAMTDTDPDTDASVLIGVGVPATDRSFEFSLDMVTRQIGDILVDKDNEWAEIFRLLIQRFEKIEHARTGGTDQGVRLAGRQMKVTALLVNDPVAGEALKPTSAMARFFAKADELIDPTMIKYIAAMKSQINPDPAAWGTPSRRYGLTKDEGSAMLVDDFKNDTEVSA
ncbi:hypothetical protein MRBLMR1_004868 [Neorhizobium sp. LMR1-1-1.1]